MPDRSAKLIFCLMAAALLLGWSVPAARAEEVESANVNPVITIPYPGTSLQVTNSSTGTTTAASTKSPLQVDIPTVKFSDAITISEGGANYINIPWLAQYIAGVYKYAVSVGAFLAAIMVTIGGFIYLTAGESGRVQKAKTVITDAVLGLVVLLGSYVLLYTVNPDLTALDALRIETVTATKFESLEFTKDSDLGSGGGTTGSAAAATQAEVEQVLKAYASCTGIDWRIMKGIAQAESGLKSNLVNSIGYQGLFQMKSPYCNWGISPYKSLFDCSNMLDPEVNAAAATTITSNALAKVVKYCPSASLTASLLAVYVGHNNGPAVMNYVLKNGGCTESKQKELVAKYYDDKKAAQIAAGKTYCTREMAKQKKCVDSIWGVQKWQHGYNVVKSVQAAGATDVFPSGAKNSSTCPKDTGKRVFDASKFAAK